MVRAPLKNMASSMSHGDALALALDARIGATPPRDLGPRFRLAISRSVMAAAQPCCVEQGLELAPWLVPRLLVNSAAACPALLQVRRRRHCLC